MKHDDPDCPHTISDVARDAGTIDVMQLPNGMISIMMAKGASETRIEVPPPALLDIRDMFNEAHTLSAYLDGARAAVSYVQARYADDVVIDREDVAKSVREIFQAMWKAAPPMGDHG